MQGIGTLHTLSLIIFLLTYTGIALGEIPGLALDRTGIAILGAIAMVASGVITPHQVIIAIDFSTILLLYSLMILSSQFRLGGFYTWVALKISRLVTKPWNFLLLLMSTSGVLSAFLTNDIVCYAFTPVITLSALKAGLNPIPYLLGLAISTNIGSAATIIGNPQNMLIGQTGKLPFGEFILWCLPPSIISLLIAYLIIRLIYSKSIKHTTLHHHETDTNLEQFKPFNRHQSLKGIIALSVLIFLFFTPFPREVSAIVIAGALLCSRTMRTKSLLGNVDWHLLTLFCALFIIIHGIEVAHIPEQIIIFFEKRNLSLQNPYILTIISTLMSNIVSNVPATMLLTKFIQHGNNIAWYILALSTTYAGNLIIIGSIANLIVFESASVYGVKVSFLEHAKTGIPTTIISLLITLLWIYSNIPLYFL